MSATAPSAVVCHYRDAFERARPTLRGHAARRAAAFARFAELGFPGAREEAWKYTSLRRLEARRFIPPTDLVGRLPAGMPEALAAVRVAMVNGHAPESLESVAPPGVSVHRLGAGDAPGLDDGALREIAGGGTERFTALNAALVPEPLLLDVAGGRLVDDVLQVTMHTAGTGPTLANPRIVVRVGPGGRAKLLLEHTDDGLHEHFVNAVLDVELADEAELTVYRLQRPGDKTFLIERIEARLDAGARLVVRDSQLGGTLSRLDAVVHLDGNSSSAEMTGVFLADGSRHLDTHVLVHHRGVGTTSLQDYRGIAGNRGRGVFNGKSIVHVGAQKSNARQVNRNLLLTPGAEIDTKPDLEIYADDVQCSHGATTGQLDAQALFYLRSRGLDESQARSALTRAFAAPVLTRVDHAPLATLVHEELDRRLERLLEYAG